MRLLDTKELHTAPNITYRFSRWLKASRLSLAGEERIRHICRQIVGDKLKGEMTLFSFPFCSGGKELRGAPLVYISDLVEQVVELLEETQRLDDHDIQMIQ